MSNIQCIEVIDYVEDDPLILFEGQEMNEDEIEITHPLETDQQETGAGLTGTCGNTLRVAGF